MASSSREGQQDCGPATAVPQTSGRTSGRTSRRRRGAVLSVELVMLLPVIAGLMMGCGEFALVLAANQKVKQASHLACRIASRPCSDGEAREQLIQRAIHQVLSHPRMIESVRYEFVCGDHTGDDVIVEVHLPMQAASPDMMAVLGFSLENRYLHARTVMSKE